MGADLGINPPDALAGAEKLSTFNARDDRVANAFTFRNAWRRAQHCIIPADAIFEPDWRSGKAVATRFTWADGAPLGVAGPCPPPGGQWHESYTMLTINADADPLFRAYHQAGMEKRMVTILPEGAYGDWLHTSAERGRDFLLPIPSDRQTPNLCPHHVLRLSTKTVCDIE
ncbi:SOS response-associated peptidase family protein [Bordetella trematum]|uniref:SOS response-associated peptidase family protein n=1 Tax=Bordetella trematum TaxID=123899 RepID=UPI001E35F862|nr:SOS response-associated peptidase family protein [Bordetella trematum]